MIGSRRGASWTAAGAIAIVLGLACGDYARDNPFDPSVPVYPEIRGPDSSFSLGDTLRYEVVTTPSFAFDRPEWEWYGESNMGIGQVGWTATSGLFVVVRYDLTRGVGPYQKTLRAYIGSGRWATKPVVFLHRATNLRAYECENRFWNWTGSKTIDLVIGGGDDRICSTHVDRRGNAIREFPAVTAAARQGIVDVIPTLDSYDAPLLRISGKTVGSTYVVVKSTQLGFVDSVLVTVRAGSSSVTP